MKSIIAGGVLIGVGFAIGDSIFLGNFDVLSILFDGRDCSGLAKASTASGKPGSSNNNLEPF